MEILCCTVTFEDNSQFILCPYSVVTDLALKIGDNKVSFLQRKGTTGKSAQVSWEVNVKAFVDREMITEQLQGDDIEQALEAVDCLWHADLLDILRDSLVTFIAYHDGLCLAGGNLSKGGLDLGIK